MVEEGSQHAVKAEPKGVGWEGESEKPLGFGPKGLHKWTPAGLVHAAGWVWWWAGEPRVLFWMCKDIHPIPRWGC